MTRIGAVDWRKEIAILAFVKSAVSKLDTENLWRHHLPRVAASPEQLQSVEIALGHALDPMYAEFLRHANGWPAFYQNVDLFGTEELHGGGMMKRAAELLSATALVALDQSRVRAHELLPIAVSTTDLDLFAIMRPNSSAPGTIIWFAGTEIDRFSTFHEYFLAMADYNRLDYRNLQKDKSWQ
jgi:hypothetical protein